MEEHEEHHEEHHEAATAVIAEQADQAKETAERAEEKAEQAIDAASSAIDTALSATATEPTVPEPDPVVEDSTASVSVDEVADLRDRLSRVEGMVDSHDAQLSAPPAESSNADSEEVVEVSTDPEPETPKEEEKTDDKPKRKGNQRRFRRGSA